MKRNNLKIFCCDVTKKKCFQFLNSKKNECSNKEVFLIVIKEHIKAWIENFNLKTSLFSNQYKSTLNFKGTS